MPTGTHVRRRFEPPKRYHLKQKRRWPWIIVTIFVTLLISVVVTRSQEQPQQQTVGTASTPGPPSPPTTVAPVTLPPATEEPSPGETVSQTNAREKAADYLAYSSFSRTGLIDQLEFEGFIEADAVYAVDALDVDWNEQAAEKAADYLDHSSFSRTGLIDQLEFEGFTPAQAEYGVGTTGL
jgi:hypothetical protein